MTKETKEKWPSDDKSGVEWIMRKLNIPTGLYQLGLSKVFIKDPETVSIVK